MTDVQFYASSESEENLVADQFAKAVRLSWVCTLIQPSNFSKPGVQNPTLTFEVDSWDGNPAQVQIQVDNNSDFSSPTWSTTIMGVPGDTTQHSVSVGSALTFGTTYYWRIRAGDGAAWGAWTASWIMIPISGASEAFESILLNAGVELITSRDHGTESILLNAGVEIILSDEHDAEAVLQNVGAEVTLDSDSYEYVLLGDVSTNVPTPHIWFLRPTSGRANDGVAIIGSGFGDTQVEFNGVIEVSHDSGDTWVPVSVVTWQTFPADPNMYGPDRLIQVYPEVVDPQHQEVEVTVPGDALPPGMLVRVKTDA